MPPTDRPPPLPPSPPPEGEGDDPLLESVEALAAGELEAEEAHALKARIAADPPLGQVYAEARHVEQMLREEPLLPLPLQLIARILKATAPRRVRPVVVLARAAACVLVFFATWFAFSGDVPAMADVAPHPRLVASLEQTPLPTPPSVRDVLATAADARVGTSTTATFLSLGAGLLLLVMGLLFALSSHRRAARGGVAVPIEGGDA